MVHAGGRTARGRRPALILGGLGAVAALLLRAASRLEAPLAYVLVARRAQGPAGTPGSAGPDAASFFADEWRDEARRCWAADADGTVPGWMGDMTPVGREYDRLVRMYVETDKKPQPREVRPWRVLEGAEAEAEDAQDQRQEDFQRAMRFFDKEGDGAQAGGTVLDVGCGMGYMARRLAQSGLFDATLAFDVDWCQLEVARSDAERHGVGPGDGLFVLRADAQELPFREGCADFAWWGMGLHKVQDAGAALAAVAAALRPGGRLLATTIPSILPGGRAEDIERKAREAGFGDVRVEQPRDSEIVLEAVK